MSWPAARGLRRRVRVTFEIPEKATSPSSWRKRHVMFFHVFFMTNEKQTKWQTNKPTNQKQSLNLEQKDIFFQQIVVVFCSSRLRDQWDLFCDIDIWPTKNLKTSSESRPPCWEQVVAPLSLQVWLPVPCPWHGYHSNPLRCNCFRGPLPWESWGKSGCSLSDPGILKINTMGDSGDHPTMSLLWINQGTADCSYDYFKTSRCLMFDRFKWFKHPRKKMQCQICRNVPNGWEVITTPRLLVQPDQLFFQWWSCFGNLAQEWHGAIPGLLLPIFSHGIPRIWLKHNVKQKVKQKTHGTAAQPVQPCFWRRKIVFDPADVMKARNTSSSTSPQQACFTVYSDNPTQSTPPFWKRGSTERKRFKTGPKKNENTELLQRLFNMFLGPGVVPRLLEVNLWKQTVFVDPLMSRVPSQRKGSSNKTGTKMHWTFHKFISLCWGRETALLMKRFPSGKCGFTLKKRLKRSGSTRFTFLSLKVPLEHQNLGK